MNGGKAVGGRKLLLFDATFCGKGPRAAIRPASDPVRVRSIQAAQAWRQRASNSPIPPCRSVSVGRVFLKSAPVLNPLPGAGILMDGQIPAETH